MVRARNRATGQEPFKSARIADLGDVAMSPVDQDEALGNAQSFVRGVLAQGIRPFMVGGDHLCTLTVLRELRAARGEAFGLVLLDSHTDLYPPYFGGRTLTHGNPFRQAIEEGCLDPTRCVMAGMRGTSYNTEDFDYGLARGVRILPIEDCMDMGWAQVMQIARDVVGQAPTYLSFDIDFIDPAYAPGTGTPEVGGPTSFEAIRCVRALRGLNLIGADLVEVAPPFDSGGITAWLGASIMFEILCAMQP
jgi:guanidinopropionase